MRAELTAARLRKLMRELARTAPRRGRFHVYILGGTTAVWEGWRASSIDADVLGDPESVLRDVQAIKERLKLNVEITRPEDFVPPLRGTKDRHVFLETIERVSFFHYDPYAQAFSKVVRGFDRDLADAGQMVRAGLVDPQRLSDLVAAIPKRAYAKYPRLNRQAVERAVDEFVSAME